METTNQGTKITSAMILLMAKSYTVELKKKDLSEDEVTKLLEKRRALLTINRHVKINGGADKDQLHSIVTVLKECEETKSSKFDELKLDDLAMHHMVLAEDIEKMETEILTNSENNEQGDTEEA